MSCIHADHGVPHGEPSSNRAMSLCLLTRFSAYAGAGSFPARVLGAIVSAATFLMILASTRGDNLMLRRSLRQGGFNQQ